MIVGTVPSMPQSTPSPIFRAADKICAQCVSFYVTAEAQKVSVALNWKTLESVLVNMTFAARERFRAESFGMRASQILKELRKIILGIWTHQEVPMIRH
jgi:hypothetical protein